MATRNGSYQSNARIEWDYSVGSVGQSTTSVTVTVRAYLRMQSGYSINGNWPVNWWGSWGTSSNSQSMNLSGGQRTQIRSWSQTVTLTDSSQSRSVAIRVQHYWGSTQDTLNFSIPARYARTPSNVQVNRLSDSNIRVAWTRNSTYTSVVVQRRVNEGSWATAAVAQGNAGNITLTDGRVNRRYQFRVQGRGGSGNSGYSAASAYVYTTPVAPTGITAERSGSGISVSVGNTTPWATRFDVEDSVGGIVATDQPLSALPYLHTDPDPAQPHSYRVRMRVYSGGNEASWLVGPWSAWSNTVQLIQPPSAPTNLSPNGSVVDLAKDVTFSWRHNSVDSSPQSSAELRYRKTGTTSWTTVTITGSTQQLVENLSSVGEGGIQWQVRTKGAHPDFSPWSALASLTLIDAPTVAILQPESIHRSTTLTVEWSYSQAQDRPQSNWQVQLVNSDTGELIEARSGSGAVLSLRLNARLEPDTNYLVRVRAATGSVWSDWAEMPFVTEFVPPREPIIEGEWNEETGSYNLTIGDADCTDDGILYQNLVQNPSMESTSGTVEVRRNLSPQPVPMVNTGFTIAGGTIGFTDGFAGRSSAVRHTRNDASAGRLAQIIGTAMTQLENFALVLQVRASEPLSGVNVYWRGNTGSTSGQAPLATVDIPAGESEIRVYGQAPNYVDNSGAGWALVWSSGTVGSTLDVTGIQVEAGDSAGPYFDGSTSPDPDLTASWEGTANASASVLTGLQVADVTPAPPGTGVIGYSTQDAPLRGERALRYSLAEGEGFTLPISNVTASAEQPVTVSARVRARDTTSAALMGYSAPDLSDLVTLPAGEWVELRKYTPNPAYASPLLGGILVIDAGGAVLPPNVIDIDMAMIVEGEYDGPYHDGDDVGWGWTGTPHASSSTELERPASTSVVIERSIDDGATWEHVTEASFEDCTLSVSDFEGLSCGTTLYRVTNSAATGASIDVVHKGLADSQAIWLGTGEGFVQTARISLHDGVGISRGRERSLEHYQGRSLGVAYMSENLSRTVSVQGMVPDTDMLRCPSVTRDELESIIVWPYPIHLHRDLHGNRVYGIAGNVGLDREWLMAHSDCGDHQGMCGLGLWAFQYDIDETEGQ